MTQGTQVHRVWVPSASIPFLRVLGSMWIVDTHQPLAADGYGLCLLVER